MSACCGGTQLWPCSTRGRLWGRDGWRRRDKQPGELWDTGTHFYLVGSCQAQAGQGGAGESPMAHLVRKATLWQCQLISVLPALLSLHCHAVAFSYTPRLIQSLGQGCLPRLPQHASRTTAVWLFYMATFVLLVTPQPFHCLGQETVMLSPFLRGCSSPVCGTAKQLGPTSALVSAHAPFCSPSFPHPHLSPPYCSAEMRKSSQ